MPTKTTGPQKLSVTYLFPFAGNRMSQPHAGGVHGTIHILRREQPYGSETWCGLTVQTDRTKYRQNTRLPKSDEGRLHAACVTAYLAR